MNDTLWPFFAPRGIVVVGASASEQKLGYGIARNLSSCGYPGAIHLVSQTEGGLFGHKVFTSILHVPDPVDLAVLALPAQATPAAIRKCGDRGIRAAVIISAGFREAGPDGAALEQECIAAARLTGMRLLGPNCIGTIDTHLPLDTSFLQPPMPPRGGIGFVSHSGAFCAALVDWSRGHGLGFSRIVSLGNQADISEADLLPHLADDVNTRVIVLYMEGVANGTRFVQAARGAARKKPVIAMKVGRSPSGLRAARSHTAALAGSDAAFQAAFDTAGVLRADDTQQMCDWARALERCPLPSGRRVAILTDAGGPGVIAADALESNTMQLADLSPGARHSLSTRLPAAASVANPVDMLASASPQDYAFCLDVLLEDGGVDSALVILPPPPMYAAEAVAREIIPIIHRSTKPVVVALLGSQLTQPASDVFTAAGVPTYDFPERAASALWALTRRRELLDRPPHDRQLRPFELAAAAGAPPLDRVAAYGIPFLPLTLATSPREAAAIARQLGFPVVLKIASVDIPHKSDTGGVLVNIKTEEELVSGYTQLLDAVKTARPDALIDGVHVQPHVVAGQDVIIGAIHDPQFGPLVMFGSGGIEAEALHDVAFALAPLDRADADQLIQRTWSGRRLQGFRSIPAVDRDAAIDALVRLSWLVHEHPELGDVEINPLRVLPKGAVALDIRFSAPASGTQAA